MLGKKTKQKAYLSKCPLVLSFIPLSTLASPTWNIFLDFLSQQHLFVLQDSSQPCLSLGNKHLAPSTLDSHLWSIPHLSLPWDLPYYIFTLYDTLVFCKLWGPAEHGLCLLILGSGPLSLEPLSCKKGWRFTYALSPSPVESAFLLDCGNVSSGLIVESSMELAPFPAALRQCWRS